MAWCLVKHRDNFTLTRGGVVVLCLFGPSPHRGLKHWLHEYWRRMLVIALRCLVPLFAVPELHHSVLTSKSAASWVVSSNYHSHSYLFMCTAFHTRCVELQQVHSWKRRVTLQVVFLDTRNCGFQHLFVKLVRRKREICTPSNYATLWNVSFRFCIPHWTWCSFIN
jgi:hypothetical protein